MVIPSVSEYLEFFSEFLHISIGPNDVIPLALSEVRPLRKRVSLSLIFRSYS